MTVSKAQPPSQLPNDANTLSVRFYIFATLPRCEISFADQGRLFDHALSEYTTLTPAEKTTLRTLLTKIRDETFTLEGYA